jgi:predicted nuclease of restriction endonuclease-like (RecB) superfamily
MDEASRELDEVVKVRIDGDTRRRFQAHARAEHRTESAQLRYLIASWLDERTARHEHR